MPRNPTTKIGRLYVRLWNRGDIGITFGPFKETHFIDTALTGIRENGEEEYIGTLGTVENKQVIIRYNHPNEYYFYFSVIPMWSLRV